MSLPEDVVTASSFLAPHANGVCIAVKLQPRASRNEIGPAHGNELKIKVTAPPVDSAANQALVDLLAETLGCSRSAVRILRGNTSRHKTVLVTGVTAEELERRLSIHVEVQK